MQNSMASGLTERSGREVCVERVSEAGSNSKVRIWLVVPVWVEATTMRPVGRRAARGKPAARARVLSARSCGAESAPSGKRRRA